MDITFILSYNRIKNKVKNNKQARCIISAMSKKKRDDRFMEKRGLMKFSCIERIQF